MIQCTKVCERARARDYGGAGAQRRGSLGEVGGVSKAFSEQVAQSL